MLWRLLFAVTARLPLPLLHVIGRAFGALLARLPGKPRRVAATNIARCLPELNAAGQRRLLRRSLAQFGCALTEGPALWYAPPEKVAGWKRAVHGDADVRAALAAGHGAILFTPHIGAWEMVGLDASQRWPITHLYKAQSSTVDALINAGRRRFGAGLAGSDAQGVRRLLAALQRGEALGILPDQDPPRGSGRYADYFGIPAHTPVLPAKLARRCPQALFLCWAERLPRGRGYRIVYEAAPAAIGQADPDAALAALNAAVEGLVRRLPEQYWWSYARFRRRPEGEAHFYP